MSLTLRMPAPGAQDNLDCLACPAPHSLADRLTEEGRPVVFVLSDQAFPAMLPAKEGDCAVIIRVEDGTLSEIEGAFYDRMGAYLRPHGNLSPGSLILIGSLSHLITRGVADYSECLVKCISVIQGRVGRGVEVAPLVPIPLHGVEHAHQVLALLDFDSWLLSGASGTAAFPATREFF